MIEASHAGGGNSHCASCHMLFAKPIKTSMQPTQKSEPINAAFAWASAIPHGRRKQDKMSEKSKTCVGKLSGKPLTEYDSEEEARQGADYANRNYKNTNLTPYECDRCGEWHLAPKNRQTPSTKCACCTGSDGRPKDLYKTRDDARRRADIIKSEKGVSLNVYQCQYSGGWHLTRTSGH